MDPHCSAVECFPNWRAKKKKKKTMGATATQKKAQGHRRRETHPGVLAQSQPLLVSVLLWGLKFTKSLFYQR